MYLVGGISLWWGEVYWRKIVPDERVGRGGEQILADRDDLPHPSCRKNPVHPTKFLSLPHQMFIFPTEQQFSCFNLIKTSFLAAVITVAARSVITMAYTNRIVH